MRNKRRVVDAREDYRRLFNAPASQFTLSTALGVVSGLLLGRYMGGDAISMILGAVGGGSIGFVAGVLVWLGSAELPDDDIQPVRFSARESETRR